MPNALAGRRRVRKRGGESWAKWEFRLLRASTKLGGGKGVRGEQMFALAVLSAVSTDAAATKIVVFCVVCAWALSFQTTLIYAWRRSTNKMAKEVQKEWERESRTRERERVTRRRSLNGGVLCVCVCLHVCVCVVYFRFCIAIFLAERFLGALPLQRVFLLWTQILNVYITFLLLSCSFSLIPSCLAWLHHGEQTVQWLNPLINNRKGIYLFSIIDKKNSPIKCSLFYF